MTALSESPFIVDCQTTGASPAHGQILEIAWSASDNADVETYLCEIEAEEGIPKRIQKLTGITDEEMADALPLAKVRKKLEAAIASSFASFAVIHFAQFERKFLEDLLGREFPLPVVCSHRVAKLLSPELPSKSIRAIAGYYGSPIHNLKRANDHVCATRLIWNKQRDEILKKRLKNLADLQSWLSTKPQPSQRQAPLDRSIRLGLPKTPGVYRMLNARDEIIYIGKATNLKSRVNSHFVGQRNLNSRHAELITQVTNIEVEETATALEAALLESDLIKSHEPPYNVALRKNERQLVFYDRDFTDASNQVCPQNPLGPFRKRGALEEALGLWRYVFLDAVTDVEVHGVESAELLTEAALQYRDTYEWPDSFRSILAAHAWESRRIERLAREEVLEPYDEIEEDEDEIEPEEIEETVESILAKFERIFLRAAREYTVSRRFRGLANMQLCWRLKGKAHWRYLSIRGGQVREARNVAKKSVEGLLCENIDEDDMSFDIPSFDRLRVLRTEIMRLVTEGRDVRIAGTLSRL